MQPNRILKTIAWNTAIVFTWTQLVWAAPASNFFSRKRPDHQAETQRQLEHLEGRRHLQQQSLAEPADDHAEAARDAFHLERLAGLAELYLPEEYGRITEVYDPPGIAPADRRLVIHIQDLHTQPEAQRHLVGILQYLRQHHDLEVVCSEGAAGRLQTEALARFPVTEVRTRVAGAFLDAGELTGEEYLAMTTDPTLPIEGIEDAETYFPNLVTFHDVMADHSGSQLVIDQLTGALEALKPKLWRRALLKLDAQHAAYEAGSLAPAEYLDTLQHAAHRLAVDVAATYPQVAHFQQLLHLEGRLDKDRTQEETTRLLANLSTAAVADTDIQVQLEPLFVAAAAMDQQRVGPKTFYERLAKAADLIQPDWRQVYPQVAAFHDYLTAASHLDGTALYRQLRQLYVALQQRLATTDLARRLADQLQRAAFLDGFVNLRVSNEQLDDYLEDRASYTLEHFRTFLEPLLTEHRLTQRYVDYNPAMLDDRLPLLERFYAQVKRRDHSMVTNTLRVMDAYGAQRSVLIAGGFHTRGITQLLREAGVSYVVVSPATDTDMDYDRYHDLLAGHSAPLPQVVAPLLATGGLRTLLPLEAGLTQASAAVIAAATGSPQAQTATTNHVTMTQGVRRALAVALVLVTAALVGPAEALEAAQHVPSDFVNLTTALTEDGHVLAQAGELTYQLEGETLVAAEAGLTAPVAEVASALLEPFNHVTTLATTATPIAQTRIGVRNTLAAWHIEHTVNRQSSVVEIPLPQGGDPNERRRFDLEFDPERDRLQALVYYRYEDKSAEHQPPWTDAEWSVAFRLENVLAITPRNHPGDPLQLHVVVDSDMADVISIAEGRHFRGVDVTLEITPLAQALRHRDAYPELRWVSRTPTVLEATEWFEEAVMPGQLTVMWHAPQSETLDAYAIDRRLGVGVGEESPQTFLTPFTLWIDPTLRDPVALLEGLLELREQLLHNDRGEVRADAIVMFGHQATVGHGPTDDGLSAVHHKLAEYRERLYPTQGLVAVLNSHPHTVEWRTDSDNLYPVAADQGWQYFNYGEEGWQLEREDDDVARRDVQAVFDSQRGTLTLAGTAGEPLVLSVEADPVLDIRWRSVDGADGGAAFLGVELVVADHLLAEVDPAWLAASFARPVALQRASVALIDSLPHASMQALSRDPIRNPGQVRMLRALDDRLQQKPHRRDDLVQSVQQHLELSGGGTTGVEVRKAWLRLVLPTSGYHNLWRVLVDVLTPPAIMGLAGVGLALFAGDDSAVPLAAASVPMASVVRVAPPRRVLPIARGELHQHLQEQGFVLNAQGALTRVFSRDDEYPRITVLPLAERGIGLVMVAQQFGNGDLTDAEIEVDLALIHQGTGRQAQLIIRVGDRQWAQPLPHDGEAAIPAILSVRMETEAVPERPVELPAMWVVVSDEAYGFIEEVMQPLMTRNPYLRRQARDHILYIVSASQARAMRPSPYPSVVIGPPTVAEAYEWIEARSWQTAAAGQRTSWQVIPSDVLDREDGLMPGLGASRFSDTVRLLVPTTLNTPGGVLAALTQTDFWQWADEDTRTALDQQVRRWQARADAIALVKLLPTSQQGERREPDGEVLQRLNASIRDDAAQGPGLALTIDAALQAHAPDGDAIRKRQWLARWVEEAGAQMEPLASALRPVLVRGAAYQQFETARQHILTLAAPAVLVGVGALAMAALGATDGMEPLVEGATEFFEPLTSLNVPDSMEAQTNVIAGSSTVHTVTPAVVAPVAAARGVTVGTRPAQRVPHVGVSKGGVTEIRPTWRMGVGGRRQLRGLTVTTNAVVNQVTAEDAHFAQVAYTYAAQQLRTEGTSHQASGATPMAWPSVTDSAMAAPGNFQPTYVLPYQAVERFLPQPKAFDAWATHGVRVVFSYQTEAQRTQLEAFLGSEVPIWSAAQVHAMQQTHQHLSVLAVETIPQGSAPQWEALGPLVLQAWENQTPLHTWLIENHLTLPLIQMHEPLRLELWNTLQSLV